MIDIFIKDNDDYIDFEIDKTKQDIRTINSFESSLLVALFGDKDKEIILNKGEGSYLFKLNQAKISTDNLNMYRFYTNQALDYLYEEKLINDIDVSVKFDKTVKLEIIINTINKESVKKYAYKL